MERDQLQNVTADCHRLIMGPFRSNCRMQKRGTGLIMNKRGATCKLSVVNAHVHKPVMGKVTIHKMPQVGSTESI